jgi:hypothetical protein
MIHPIENKARLTGHLRASEFKELTWLNTRDVLQSDVGLRANIVQEADLELIIYYWASDLTSGYKASKSAFQLFRRLTGPPHCYLLRSIT